MKTHKTMIVLTAAASALIVAGLIGCRSASVVHRLTPHRDGEQQKLVRSSSPELDEESRLEPAVTADENVDSIQLVAAESTTVSAVDSTPMDGTNRYSIEAAIETALSQNPDLITLRQNENVGLGVLGVAQTYPFNPFVQVQATPLQDRGTTYHYVLLMQQIQLAHQQQFREEAACAALNSVRWNIVQAELLNVAQTERLYFTAVYQRGLRDIAALNAENNRELLSILEVQQQAGQATAADVAIVRLDAKSSKQQRNVAEANYQTALLDLKRHMCLSADSQIDLDPDVLNWNWRPAATTEVMSMAANRPDVQAARADAEAARANSSLANANRTPDLQIGPYYQRTDSGNTFLGFRAQMDIPVINDGTPMLRQRESEYCQRVTAAQQLAIRAQLEADAAAQRYQRALTIRAENTDGTQPSFPVELQRLEEQFKANEVDVLRVIQARNSMLQSQKADLDALNELMQSAVAVTAATGLPLESFATKNVDSPNSNKTVPPNPAK